MITSQIGRIFLNAYNEKYAKEYDAKTFFSEVFYPLFFNHQKYMMTAGNSPLENPKLSWDDMIRGKKPFETEEQRVARYEKLMKKIDDSDADASIAIGYPSLDVCATTSGMVSNLQITNSKDEIYLSWIGAGLGVGVQGGFSILFSDRDVLLEIFLGWKYYREMLNSTSNLKGNQINTWNGQWLAHRYSRNYNPNNPMGELDVLTLKDGLFVVDTQSWTKVLIALARNLPNPQLLGYVYNIGQTNTTIGFIPFSLPPIRKATDLYDKLFGIASGKKAEKLWGTAYGFKSACQAGVIGLKALAPKGLKEYIEKAKMPKYKEDEETIISFNTYKIWLMAMLNNEDLWAKSEIFAQNLLRYATQDKKAKTQFSNRVKILLEATNKHNFIKGLTEIVADAENKDNIKEIASVINAMPSDNVPYFLTLIRFHYASINNVK